MARITTLGEFVIQRQADFPYAKGELSRLMSAIRLATKVVNSEINKAGLVDEIMGSAGEENVQGEVQQKLDVYANRIFMDAMWARKEICGLASEEEDSFVAFEDPRCRNASYVLLIDPLDGSSNIDVNVSIGTIFSIYRRVSEIGGPATIEDFLQPGNRQVAAGYIIYGSSTMLVYTTGRGVNGFTYDPSVGVFYLSHPDVKMPESGAIYSVNEGNFSYFPTGVQNYINYCKVDHPKSGRPYSSRYIGSMVSDFHRNLIKGGIYMYPATKKNPNGKLRLCYELNPIAFLTEQAGGKASDGSKRILDIKPTELHQRAPFFGGSLMMVDKVEKMMREAELKA